MNEQELQTAVKDQQEIVVLMDKRVQQLEKQQSESKDYSAEIAQITKKLEHVATVEYLAELQASNNSQIATLGADIIDIKEQQTKQGNIIGKMPKQMKFQLEHRFTDKQRPYIITGIILLLVLALSLFASFQLWRSNSALKNSDIKFRMVRLFYPQVSLDIDSIYNNNPKQLEIWVKQEEERLLAIRKAEENAEQSEKEAKKAKEDAKKAREKVNKIKKN
ncbi:hypothetical protein [Olivibacter sitiensis]|uniref:hypothetical protein n=1 Tax=Olivibacter sitiensis TaxID=376470 RepID=UPI00042064F3|nr:hypothetical protein [Olivibacter sitiensis]